MQGPWTFMPPPFSLSKPKDPIKRHRLCLLLFFRKALIVQCRKIPNIKKTLPSLSPSPPLPYPHPSTPPYKCIGAKLRILLHLFPLSSCPTTPFRRLPIGSPPLLIRTQALSSNFTTLPSGRENCLAVRTITAWRMSPLRTLLAALTLTLPPPPDSEPKLRCFWTTTIMRSPGKGDVSGLDEVGGGVGGGGSGCGCMRWLLRSKAGFSVRPSLSLRTNSGCSVSLQDVDALGHGGAGVVDDIQHGLE